MKRAFVTGANGHVGSALIPLLAKEGWEISGLVRKTSNIAAIRGYPIRLTYGDMMDLESLRKAARGCDVLFHLAAPTVSYTAGDKTAALTGLENVCALAKGHPTLRRIVYVSSTVTVGVVGDFSKTLAEESFMHLVGTPYQDMKWEAEQRALACARKGDVDIVIVNPSTIMGAGDLRPMPPNRLIIDFLNYAGSWRWLSEFQLRGAPVWFDTGFSVVDVGDIARGIVLAGQKGRAGERYILSGDNITMRELHQALGELTGLPAPLLHVPRSLMYAASWFFTKTMEHPPLSYDLAKTMVGKYAFFSAAKAKRELGYAWTPYRETVARAIRWFLETPLIREDRKVALRRRIG